MGNMKCPYCKSNLNEKTYSNHVAKCRKRYSGGGGGGGSSTYSSSSNYYYDDSD